MDPFQAKLVAAAIGSMATSLTSGLSCFCTPAFADTPDSDPVRRRQDPTPDPAQGAAVSASTPQ